MAAANKEKSPFGSLCTDKAVAARYQYIIKVYQPFRAIKNTSRMRGILGGIKKIYFIYRIDVL